MSIPPKRSAVASQSARSCAEVAHVARLRDDAVEAEVVAAPRREAEVDAALVQQARDRRADARGSRR